jgi:hypothetical protein
LGSHGEVVLLAHATYYELVEIGMENSCLAMLWQMDKPWRLRPGTMAGVSLAKSWHTDFISIDDLASYN